MGIARPEKEKTDQCEGSEAVAGRKKKVGSKWVADFL